MKFPVTHFKCIVIMLEPDAYCAIGTSFCLVYMNISFICVHGLRNIRTIVMDIFKHCHWFAFIFGKIIKSILNWNKYADSDPADQTRPDQIMLPSERGLDLTGLAQGQ
jgi:hypothetical protein